MRREDRERFQTPYPPIDRETLIQAAEALAAEFPGIQAVYLFGSRAQGLERSKSDVDLAVLMEPRIDRADRFWIQAQMAEFVEERLSVPVDVVVGDPDLSPRLLFGIFCMETILFCRNYERAHNFACQMRAIYRDMQLRLDRAFERAMQRMGAGPDAYKRP